MFLKLFDAFLSFLAHFIHHFEKRPRFLKTPTRILERPPDRNPGKVRVYEQPGSGPDLGFFKIPLKINFLCYEHKK